MTLRTGFAKIVPKFWKMGKLSHLSFSKNHKLWNQHPCSTVMSYRHSFYLAFIYSFWYQINVVPMQWLSPLLRFFQGCRSDGCPTCILFLHKPLKISIPWGQRHLLRVKENNFKLLGGKLQLLLLISFNPGINWSFK